MAGLYIHIPFCKQLCHYCDFFSCISLAKTGPVLEALLREMELRRRFLPGDSLSTLYVGGGTPSVYAPQELGRLTARARELWDCTGLEESTVEVNPDDLSPACLDGLLRAGFDRLSIGIQSFVDRDLRLMNRRHTAEGAEKAVREAQRAGFGNISIDLIYGIPGMSDREWRDNLERALSLEVQHISAYHLTVEPRTVFGRRAAQGKFTPVDEETSQRQYLTLHRTLTAAGYEHYEISNFARPGRRSRHNSAYWTGEPYLGIGPSAHSYDGRRRSWSPPSLARYLGELEEGTLYEEETLTEEERYDELVMVSLRRAEGVDTAALERRFGARKLRYFEESARRFVEAGILEHTGGRYRLRPEEYLVSDGVICELFWPGDGETHTYK